MTPEEALNVLSSRGGFGADRHIEAVLVITELIEGAPEVQCPNCGAVIRARMADAVQEPCDPCLHARDDHEDGVGNCSQCDCREWWKFK